MPDGNIATAIKNAKNLRVAALCKVTRDSTRKGCRPPEAGVKQNRRETIYSLQASLKGIFLPKDAFSIFFPFDDAVLLVLSEHAGHSKYKNILFPNSKKPLTPTQMEELRNVYVAITRPKKILVIAAPQSDCDIWKRKLSLN